MSRKHFIALAAEIAKIVDPTARTLAAVAVADAAAGFSPSFDRARFFAACRV